MGTVGDNDDASEMQGNRAGATDDTDDILFTEPVWPLSESALKHLFQRLGRRAEAPRLHPHLLRHTYACRYLLAHRDPIALKTMLGYTTLTMTNHYLSAVEGMQVIQSDRVSVVDAMNVPFSRVKRRKREGRGISAEGCRAAKSNGYTFLGGQPRRRR